jgi:hypothetical protein
MVALAEVHRTAEGFEWRCARCHAELAFADALEEADNQVRLHPGFVEDAEHRHHYGLSRRAAGEWRHAQRRRDASWSRFVPRAHHGRTPAARVQLRSEEPFVWVVCICSQPNPLAPLRPTSHLAELLQLN